MGDEFAIHGFTSNGRRDVSYFRYKDFGMPYAAQAKAALAGITPLLSTRMGPAIRHAGERSDITVIIDINLPLSKEDLLIINSL